MLNGRAFLILALATALACSHLMRDKAPRVESSPVMSALLLNQDQLPRGCKPRELEPGKEGPHGIKVNPYLSADREFVESFAGAYFYKETGVRPDDVVEALFSVYLCPAEVGVFAWRFKTPDAAKAGQEDLEHVISSRRKDSFPVYRVRDVLVLLWYDYASQECVSHMEAVIRETLAKYENQH